MTAAPGPQQPDEVPFVLCCEVGSDLWPDPCAVHDDDNRIPADGLVLGSDFRFRPAAPSAQPDEEPCEPHPEGWCLNPRHEHYFTPAQPVRDTEEGRR